MKGQRKWKKRLLTCCLAVLWLGVSVGPGVAQAAQSSPTVTLEVVQVFEQTGGTKEGNFQYVLTALDADNPMPEGTTGGSCMFAIKGSSKAEIGITYTQEGKYEYQIAQKVTTKETGYTYDIQIYTIQVYIKNSGGTGLISEVTVKNEAGDKVSSIEFTNRYVKPGGQAARATGTTVAKTGDTSNIRLFIALMGASLILLVIGKVFAVHRREREKGREDR